MKLSNLYESHAVYGPGEAFYGDPATKKQGKNDASFLMGGEKDRSRFLNKMQGRKKKKRKK